MTLDYPPPATIAKIMYAYTSDGMLQLVTAYDADTGVLSQNQFDYDERRNLLHEWQQHGGAVTSGSPAVDYTWGYSPLSAYNFNRLTGMTYPARPGFGETGQRTLSFNYGNNTDGIDSALSRITQIVDSSLGSSPAAEYAYMGMSRRVGLTLGNGIAQSLVGSSGYEGLDAFGRVLDLHFKDASSNTLHRYQYGYDLAGNRTYARATQMPISSTAHDNDRSYLYGYDGLSRLISSHLGKLNSGNTQVTADSSVALERLTNWGLDNLGNWADRVRYDWPAGADPTIGETGHDVDRTNAIRGLLQSTDGENLSATKYISDPTGNLVFDGQYVYQYDAWNRLVQVNEAGTLAIAATYDGQTWTQTASDFDATGKIDPASGHAIGDVVMQCIYDGVGRLTQLRRVTEGSTPTTPLFDTEDYYYDGVRRVQEVLSQPDAEHPTDPPITWTEREYSHRFAEKQRNGRVPGGID